MLVALADYARRVRPAVEGFLQLRFDEGRLLLDDQDLFEGRGEPADDLPLERPDHPELQDPHAGALQLAV